MIWKPLSLSPAAGTQLPPLLIATSFKADVYTVHLTDLRHIWSESLDRRAIIRRSREENTSIDPSNGDQFPIFLDKIKTGLVAAQNTTLALTIDVDPGRPRLILNITVKLPAGLAPLEWPIRLSAAPQPLLTSQLIVPLLRAQHMRTRELDDLREVLREKDHVIQKLLDKLEISGTGLGEVFPQAAGGKTGRKVDRKKAEERVKGLGAFNMEAWREKLGDDVSQDITQLIREVSTDGISEGLHIQSITETPEEEDWWENIKGITVHLESGKISTNGPPKFKGKSPAKPQVVKQDSFEDDAFQVQATPPHLTSPSRNSTKHATDDSTHDKDPDAPFQLSKIPDSFPRSPPPQEPLSTKPAKKLGAVGGKKAVPKPTPPAEDDSSTADEFSPPRRPSSEKRTPSPAPESIKAVVRPKTSLLGKIGGKKEAPPPPSEPEPEPAPTVKEHTPVKPKRGKLGQIGGKKKEVTPTLPVEPGIDAEASSSTAGPVHKKNPGTFGGETTSAAPQEEAISTSTIDARGRSKVKQEREATPEPRETSLERADRKREMLKRELEQKAKAPVKKKRKF